MSGAPRPKRSKVGNPLAGPASPSSPRPKAVFVAVYNFKGGCGKTFVTRELAAAAVKAGKKVGMVDIDPQCNLTSWWLPSSDPYLGDGVDKVPENAEDEDESNDDTDDDPEEPDEQAGVPDTEGTPMVDQVGK